MGELTNRVSKGPDSFLDVKAVPPEGCGNGLLCLITCERGVGRNGRVRQLSIKQLRYKKRNGRTHQLGEQWT